MNPTKEQIEKMLGELFNEILTTDMKGCTPLEGDYESDSCDGAEFLGNQEVEHIKKECKKNKFDVNYANDCEMWIMQLKAFVLDSLLDETKRNSQIFLSFLDELNKISVVN